jgi:hypothetical protein
MAKARFRGSALKSKRPCISIHGVSFLLRQPTSKVRPATCRKVKAATGVQEELMPYPRHYSKRNEYTEPKTKEAAWPAKKADYLTLVLASLALSMAITLLIIPQLQRSPFF